VAAFPVEPGRSLEGLAINGYGQAQTSPARVGICDRGPAAVGEIGADGRVERVAVERGEDASDGRPGWRVSPAQQVPADADRIQQAGAGAVSPFGEFIDAFSAGGDGCGVNEQDRGQGVSPASPRARVGN
jgi:hypothetical protein